MHRLSRLVSRRCFHPISSRLRRHIRLLPLLAIPFKFQGDQDALADSKRFSTFSSVSAAFDRDGGPSADSVSHACLINPQYPCPISLAVLFATLILVSHFARLVRHHILFATSNLTPPVHPEYVCVTTPGTRRRTQASPFKRPRSWLRTFWSPRLQVRSLPVCVCVCVCVRARALVTVFEHHACFFLTQPPLASCGSRRTPGQRGRSVLQGAPRVPLLQTANAQGECDSNGKPPPGAPFTQCGRNLSLISGIACHL